MTFIYLGSVRFKKVSVYGRRFSTRRFLSDICCLLPTASCPDIHRYWEMARQLCSLAYQAGCLPTHLVTPPFDRNSMD